MSDKNWVSSLVRHMLAEPALLSHLQVSLRQVALREMAGMSVVTNGAVFKQVSLANNTSVSGF